MNTAQTNTPSCQSDTEDIHVGHFNLGSFLLDHGQPEAALPQHLAAALIQAIAGRAHLQDSLDMAARDLTALGGTGRLPADVNELERLVAQVLQSGFVI